MVRAPENAPLKSKMIYASSKDAIKKKFTGEGRCCGTAKLGSGPVLRTEPDVCSPSRMPCVLWAGPLTSGVLPAGIKHEWQVNGLDDIQDRQTLAEKLGGNVVVSLEGSPV